MHHKGFHARVKAFGHTVHRGVKKAGAFLDAGLGHAHNFVSRIDPDTVGALAGREYGEALRHTKRALGGYEAARTLVAGAR